VGRPLRLLVTSIGSLVGRSVVACLEDCRERIQIIATNSVAEAVPGFDCDVLHLVPPTADGEGYVAAHARILAAECPDFLLPTRDDELAVLPMAIERLAAGVPRPLYLGAAPAVGRITTDKRETARFALAHGLSFAATAWDRAGADALVAAHGFPLIGKPRFGFASRGVFILRDRPDLDRILALGTHVVQELVGPPGDLADRVRAHDLAVSLVQMPVEPYTGAMVVTGPDGRVVDAMIEDGLLEGGRVVRMEPVDDPQALAVSLDWARALAPLGLVGGLNVEGRRLACGRFVPFELNARLTGATSARALVGFDDVRLLLNAALPAGRRLPAGAPRRAGAVVLTSRYQRIPDAARALAVTGSWRRSRGADAEPAAPTEGR